MSNTLKSGLGAYGAFRTYTGTIVAVIVSLSMCVLGGYLIKNPDKHTAVVQGTVETVTSVPGEKGQVTYSIVAKYNIGGKDYNVSGQVDQIYNKGQSVQVFYDPKNPGDAVLKPVPSWMGWALVGVATLISLGSIGFAYFFSRLGNTGRAVVGGATAAGNAWRIFGSD